LVEPLTTRELDILELLAQRYQNKEIADQLSIAPTTVKTHLKHLYQKLQVSTRRQAIAQGHALGLLTHR
jgi:LuxR family maltose regulon positive regulatory protein